MRSEGFPFIVWGSGGWTLVRIVLLGASGHAWGFVHFDVAARAFRVAGVGNGVTCCVAGHRFAWQAQGIG